MSRIGIDLLVSMFFLQHKWPFARFAGYLEQLLFGQLPKLYSLIAEVIIPLLTCWTV